MSPRSNRPRRPSGRRAPGPGPVPRSLDSHPRRQTVRGREFMVRPVRGDSDRPYRCPGCDQLIVPGTPHLVVWPDDLLFGDGLADRRHWHTGCWNHR